MWYSNLGKTFISRHLSHRFTSASNRAAQKSFRLCHSHFRTSVSTSSSSAKHLPPSCEPLYDTTLLTVNMKHFFMNILRTKPFCPQKIKSATERCTSVLRSWSTVAIFTTEISLWTQYARLLPILLWKTGLCCYLVIRHRKFITAVLLPFADST
jgi:hypothetical protein